MKTNNSYSAKERECLFTSAVPSLCSYSHPRDEDEEAVMDPLFIIEGDPTGLSVVKTRRHRVISFVQTGPGR